MHVDDQGIFLIRNGELVVMRQEPYESEELLQQALARFPAVIAGGATSGEGADALLLVRREMGVPSSESSGGTWSLDHLFLDPAGVPVVVEVKRSSDTRIRREVVGQMLDYAANAVKYWPASELREQLDATAAEVDTTGEALLREFRPDIDPETFWAQVETNLVAGRIRMVFVADALPPELIRIIEFLNEQMSPAEVLGVAVPQYVGDDMQVLVPQLVGATTTAAASKHQATGTAWNETTFLAAAADRCSAEEIAFLERLFQHLKERGDRFSWGRGITPGVSGWYHVGGISTPLWTTNAGNPTTTSHAYLSVYLPNLKLRLTTDRLEDVVATLEGIPALKPKLDEARAADFEGKYPSAYLIDFVNNRDQVRAWFDAFDLALP
jgi:hypothetical protein